MTNDIQQRAKIEPPTANFGNCNACSRRVRLLNGHTVSHVREGRICGGSGKPPFTAAMFSQKPVRRGGRR